MKNLCSLDHFQLKCLGLVLMTFDHIHQMFYFAGAPLFFTMLGRPVTILFIFLSVEGFLHSKNTLRYLRNLLFGFWFMAIFSLWIQNAFPLDNVALMNSIFGTLFLTVLVVYALDKIIQGLKNRQWKDILVGFSVFLFLVVHQFFLLLVFNQIDFFMLRPTLLTFLLTVFPSFLMVESAPLIFAGPLFYLFRRRRLWQIYVILIFALVSTGFHLTHLFSQNIQWMMAFAAIPVWLYNGTKGKSMKWFFYAYYPLHIYFLYLLSYFYQNAS